MQIKRRGGSRGFPPVENVLLISRSRFSPEAAHFLRHSIFYLRMLLVWTCHEKFMTRIVWLYNLLYANLQPDYGNKFTNTRIQTVCHARVVNNANGVTHTDNSIRKTGVYINYRFNYHLTSYLANTISSLKRAFKLVLIVLELVASLTTISPLAINVREIRLNSVCTG